MVYNNQIKKHIWASALSAVLVTTLMARDNALAWDSSVQVKQKN